MVLNIVDYDHQGRGISYIDNKIIFIPNTLIGEEVEVEITKDKKKYMEGKVIKFIKTSPDRQNLCPYYPRCGGCQLLHMPYDKQLEYKENKIKNIFNRYHIETKINNITYSDKHTNYRNKVTFQVKDNKLGYYEEKSYNFIQIDNCLLLQDNINSIIKELPTNKNKIIVRANENECNIDDNKKIMHTIVDKKFLVSNEAFFQVNPNVTPLLYGKVKSYLDNEEIILDLYCGTGTIAIFCSDKVKSGIGIEINKEAINNAIENAKLNNIDNIKFICGDAGHELKKINIKPNTIIVDPPRAGLNDEAIKTILDINSNKIIYVSCDPMTLVRDLNILKEKYNIVEVTPFDMFPNTYHVECVCLLIKKDLV